MNIYNKELEKFSVIDIACRICICSVIFMYSVIAEAPLIIEMGILTITCLILFLKNLKSGIRIDIFFLWSIMFLTSSIFSWIISDYTIENKMIIVRIVYLIVLASMIITYLDSLTKIEYILKCYLLAGIIIIIRLIISTPWKLLFNSRMGITINLNSNSIGITMAFCIFVCIYFIQNNYNNMKKLTYNLLLIIYLIFLIGSGSRKAIIDLVVGTCIMYVFKPNKNRVQGRKKLIKFIFFISLGMLISYYMCMKIPYLYDVIGSRFEGLINNRGNLDQSGQIRYSMIENGINLFKEKPIFGYGVNSFAYLTIFGVYSHSNYIELLVSNGFVGMFIYYYIYVWIIIKQYNLIRTKVNVNALFLTIPIITLINDIAMVSYYSIYSQMLPIILGTSFFYYKKYEGK